MRLTTKLFGTLGIATLFAVGCGDSGGTSSTSGSGGGDGGGTTSSTSASGGGSTSGSGGAGSSCDQICDKNVEIEMVLVCGYDGTTCVSDCDTAFAQLAQGCVAPAEAYNDCLIAQPPEDFACNPDGTATLSTTACQAEYDALVSCS
jgi:hypothetical protein